MIKQIYLLLCMLLICNARQDNPIVGYNVSLCDNDLFQYLYELQDASQNNTDILNQIKQIIENECAYTPLSGPSIVISQPGSYCLNQDVQGPITINSSNVVLDLNAHRITGGSQGIVINSGYNNILVSNGFISDTQDEAIALLGNNDNIIIDKICLNNCANNVLYQIKTTDGSLNSNINVSNCKATGGSGFVVFNRVSDGLISNVIINNANQASTLGVVTLSNTNQVSVKNVVIQDLNVEGMTTLGMYNAQKTLIDQCTIRNITAQSNLSGIYADNNSSDCIIKKCMVQALSSVNSGVYGLLVNDALIQDCVINNLATQADGVCVGVRSFGTINIQRCLINKIYNGYGFIGVSLIGNGTIKDCVINNLSTTNTSEQRCYGIQTFGDIEIDHCSVADINTFDEFTGIELNGNTNIKNSTLQSCSNSNSVDERSFGIQSITGNMTIENCFIGNVNVVTDFIAVKSVNPTIIRDCTIEKLLSSRVNSGPVDSGLVGISLSTKSCMQNSIIQDLNLTMPDTGLNGQVVGLSMAGNNVCVDNCLISNLSSNLGSYGIYGVNITHPHISDVLIDNIIGLQQAYGMNMIISSSALISDCSINNIQSSNNALLIAGIYCGQSLWGLVKNNSITNITPNSYQPNSTSFGIRLADLTSNMIIRKNSINNIDGVGILLATNNCIVDKNEVSNCRQDGIFDAGTNSFIIYNNAFNNNPNYNSNQALPIPYQVLTGSTQFIYGANVKNY